MPVTSVLLTVFLGWPSHCPLQAGAQQQALLHTHPPAFPAPGWHVQVVALHSVLYIKSAAGSEGGHSGLCCVLYKNVDLQTQGQAAGDAHCARFQAASGPPGLCSLHPLVSSHPQSLSASSTQSASRSLSARRLLVPGTLTAGTTSDLTQPLRAATPAQ